MATAFRNPDESIAVEVFNLAEEDVTYSVAIDKKSVPVEIKRQALQTIVIRK
jgi:hypothetical protein